MVPGGCWYAREQAQLRAAHTLMPGPFVSALAAIPWPVILRQAPILLKAADALLASSRRRSAHDTAATDLQALRARIAELEQQQQAYADVVKQLADHINAITVAAQASSLRSRQSFVVATVGVGLGLVACLLAWLR